MHRVSIRNGRSPFEFALVTVSATSGLLGLALKPGPSASIIRAFGEGTPWFYLAMLVSAVTVMLGALWPRTSVRILSRGMRIERAGLLPLGGACLAYGAATLAMSGRSALIAAMLIGGIGVAAWVRARIITTDLSRLDELLDLEPPSRATDREEV